MLVCGRTKELHAIQMVATGIFQSCRPLWCLAVAALLCDSISTGEESHGKRFPSLWKIPRKYLSIIEVLSKMSTAKFSTNLNHARSHNSPISMKNQDGSIERQGSFCSSALKSQLMLHDVCKLFFY